MSIAVTALQYLTMLVLREVSIIGDNVLDNPLDPFPSDTISRPTVAVYVGEDSREEVDTHGLFGAQHRVEISIQTFLPASIKLTIPAGQEVELSARGNGLQFILGQIGGEMDRLFAAGQSEACELWRMLIGGSPEKVTVTPWLMQVTDGSKNGTRIPAVERLYVVKTAADPLFSEDDVPEFWERVLTLFEADEEFAPVASLIRALATGLGDLPTWRVAQAQLGTTEDAVKAMGLTPYADHEASPTDDAAELSEITLDPLGLTASEVLPPEN